MCIRDRSIDRAISERPGPVRFRWVRGHVGNHYNEMADVLAGEAARAVASGALAPAPVSAPAPTPAAVAQSTPEAEDAFTLF